jgi:DNA-directed RNA polymerase subunit RPC12/RpoP
VAVDVHRCDHCGREVLVRHRPRPGEPLLSDAELRRRLDEELRPSARGRPGRSDTATRLRDDIWLAIADGRETPIPREEIPGACPACGAEAQFVVSRVIDG